LGRIKGRDHRLGVVSSHDALLTLHQLRIPIGEIHPYLPILPGKPFHSGADLRSQPFRASQLFG
jgi:hypothetical protein